MTMVRRTVSLALLAAAALATGCATAEVRNARQINVGAGVATYKETHFAPPSALTFGINTRDWSPNPNVGGSQVTFLWGLFTYNDY